MRNDQRVRYEKEQRERRVTNLRCDSGYHDVRTGGRLLAVLQRDCGHGSTDSLQDQCEDIAGDEYDQIRPSGHCARRATGGSVDEVAQQRVDGGGEECGRQDQTVGVAEISPAHAHEER